MLIIITYNLVYYLKSNNPTFLYFMNSLRLSCSKVSTVLFILTLLSFNFSLANSFQESFGDVGYRIGKIQSYKKLKTSQKSSLFQIVASELDDGRPMKLLNLTGSHYDVGYDYGFMLADEIEYSYKMLFQTELNQNKTLITIMEAFLDWQYDSYVRKDIPLQFLTQIKGMRDGAQKSKKIKNINKLLERVLVISDFPGSLDQDIPSVLFDEFFRSILRIKNPQILNYIQQNTLYVVTKIKQFIKKKAIMCSFFGVWGSRTQNGELFTMRNLDWASNTGINLNKLVVVFNIDSQIPHAVLGFPGLLGALTGISAKGITVHQAGQSSDLQTMQGFQWTLRMRYVMMKASNLNEALKIWNATKNTLGMNFMIGSAIDKKAVAIETMRGYNAFFQDNDPRQNRTIFTDEKGNKYVGGFSMPEVIFRTNHAYDQIIRKHSTTKFRAKNDDSIIRYFLLRDMFNFYQNKKTQISYQQAVNITAILGDKGGKNIFYSCKNNYQGGNVISVAYLPSQLKMWAAFEYGYKQSFRSACCGVYVQIDLKPWFRSINQEQKINQ